MTSAVPSRARTCSRAGSSAAARKTSQVTAGAATTLDSTPSLASCSWVPVKASVAIRMDTANPIPAIAPTPATAAQPTGGRSLPWLTLVSSHDAPVMPTGFPAT
jgi:hypothetical protein